MKTKKDIVQRLRLIYLPYLLIAVCLISGYTFLHWLLFIRFHVFSLDEEVLNLWLPIALPWLPLYFWLKPRIKGLVFKKTARDPLSILIFFASIAIVAPTIIAQYYLETASGTLTQLSDINQIENQNPTKYYTITNIYLDKRDIGVQSTFDVSGRYNESFNMHIYIAVPIFSSSSEVKNNNCIAWCGIKYSRQINNHNTQEQKETAFNRFASFCQDQFDALDEQFIYFDRIGNTADHKAFDDAIKKNKRFLSSTNLVLVPVYTPFEARNGNKLAWVFGAFGIGAAAFFLMLLIPSIDETKAEDFYHGVKQVDKQAEKNTSIYLPREGYMVTPTIMYLNIGIFIIMVFSGLGVVSFQTKDLLNWGANYRPLVMEGQWWRLITNIFLHGGLMHVLVNMYALVFIGLFLEPKMGKVKYALTYILAGILASSASVWWYDGVARHASISVGASGAIFGLYGTLLALILVGKFDKKFALALLPSILIFVFINLGMGLAGNGIDNAAHIGGLISGFVIGLVLSPLVKQEEDQKMEEETDQNNTQVLIEQPTDEIHQAYVENKQPADEDSYKKYMPPGSE